MSSEAKWPQVQGCLFVTGRKWWDFQSYYPHPKVDDVLVRTYPDPEYQDNLAKAMETFVEELLEAREVYEARGKGSRFHRS